MKKNAVIATFSSLLLISVVFLIAEMYVVYEESQKPLPLVNTSKIRAWTIAQMVFTSILAVSLMVLIILNQKQQAVCEKISSLEMELSQLKGVKPK